MQKYLAQNNVDIFVSLLKLKSSCNKSTNHSLYRGPTFIAMNFDTLIYLTRHDTTQHDLLRFWLNLVSGFFPFFFPSFFCPVKHDDH